YDPATDIWRTRASMLRPRSRGGAAAAPNGKVYAIGGESSTSLATVEEYDPATDAWVPKPGNSFSSNRCCFGVAAATNGKIYVIGGHISTGTLFGEPSGAVDEYDPATDRWTA